MNMPLVSIVTCVYERQEFLPYLINQIKAQDFPHAYLEWIIMDDSQTSTDVFQNLPRTSNTNFGPDLDAETPFDLDGISVYYYHLDQKISLGEKRTLLNAKCRGDYIVVCDDDDYYPPTRVTHGVNMLYFHPNYQIAGVDTVYLYFTDDRQIYQSRPTFTNHALCNTLVYTKAYSQHHHFGLVDYGEESIFTLNWKEPMLQLDPFQTVLMIAHARNTIDKRPFRPFLKKVNLKLDHFIQGPNMIFCGDSFFGQG